MAEADPVVPFAKLDCHGVQHKLGSTNGSSQNIGRQSTFCRDDESGKSPAINTFYSNDCFREEQKLSSFRSRQREQQLHLFSDNLDPFSPPLEKHLGEIANHQLQERIEDVEPKKEEQYPFFAASFELLNSYGNGFKLLNTERIIETINHKQCQKVVSKESSTEEIMRIAAAKFIRSSPQSNKVDSILEDPFRLTFHNISKEDHEKIQLVELLLAAAEKVGNEQFDNASRLLKAIDSFSSNSGHPVQRVVYYFSEVLQEIIDNKTGKDASEALGKKQSFDFAAETMILTPAILAYHQNVPFNQITHFVGIQAIVDNVVGAKRIHVIDFFIRSGMQWSVLMQALVSRNEFPVEHLKMTAIGTCKQVMEDTGKRLMSFAETMNLAFSFHIVVISDFLELKEDLFKIDAEEAAAVYTGYSLNGLLKQPDMLDSIMKVIRNINPCVMVVTEMEANHNSPTFGHRFVEALFYYSANFDCLDAFMERDDPNRLILESMYFREGIKNIVSGDKEERKIRSVKIDVWRAFFSRFGMEELELSPSCLDQANFINMKFGNVECCTIDMDGKSLIIGWKGTPLNSLSAWKFISE